jgi:amino acid transporter
MSDERLGFVGALAIALGGMIGGGIYAVMGVVTGIAGAATWAAFVVAGVVALSAGYSYDRLNRLVDDAGGSVTYIQAVTGRGTAAGMVGWTLLVGYVGSMAMYAFAFGEFTLSFDAVPAAVAGVPLRPVVSVLAVAGFVGLNLLGTRTTGTAEVALVGAKVLVLVVFGAGGVAYALGVSAAPLSTGLGRLVSTAPLVAAGVSFVAFQGWQLLFYDQGSVTDPAETIPRAVYVSIVVAVAIYVLVAVATYNLAPDALVSHPHTALRDAAERVGGAVGLARLGGVLIAASALFSTGSAINATLFSTSHFARGMLDDDLLPDAIGDADADGVPPRTLLVLGAVTAVLAAVGTLEAITNFASIAFVVVFASMNALALSRRDREGLSPLPPLVGLVGAAGFAPLILYRLYRTDPRTFYAAVALAAVVVAVELLYFERDVVVERLPRVDDPSGR